jgi:hypothetical protein
MRRNAQPVLRLGNLKLAIALQLNVAHPQVRSSEVDGEVGTLFLTGGPVKDEGREHRLREGDEARGTLKEGSVVSMRGEGD